MYAIQAAVRTTAIYDAGVKNGQVEKNNKEKTLEL
jgi:hypothetical protein